LLRDRFEKSAARLGLNREREPLDASQFVRPRLPGPNASEHDDEGRQASLF
jgi:hypothetical protein